MILTDIDPSLHNGAAPPKRLGDGFSPPPRCHRNTMHAHSTPTHPVEPEPMSPDGEDGTPNPTQLPIEPEFGPMLPPAEPEDPGVKRPHL
ncbi:MAG: hypothetical protein JWP65_3736 [Ramlibacter sp.]|jgi:hypothetical protein|uniref:hypothetical protein n=1 Tax=Ramlibacter sp. TaxID=1917967 RepID=UPI0026163D5B|nr:hypothetical protein [Ramlibacter sp.]MDB5753315.1 hypothetical protein [Ramlibacter sp.]